MSVQDELQIHADERKAAHQAEYFQCKPGGYGEGDAFLGLTVPQVRSVAKKYWQLPFGDVEKLLRSKWHEERLCALLILVAHFERDPENRTRIYEFYMQNLRFLNNWDLVDNSARFIVGEYLAQRSRGPLITLAKSSSVWERRIAVVATHAFIVRQQFADTFALCELLMRDKHDLMHKACGWMLREVYKQNPTALESFLRAHHMQMPRTMLRYAIERMPEKKRKAYLAGTSLERAVPLPRVHGALVQRVSRP